MVDGAQDFKSLCVSGWNCRIGRFRGPSRRAVVRVGAWLVFSGVSTVLTDFAVLGLSRFYLNKCLNKPLAHLIELDDDLKDDFK
jgi:hypothetical protein